MTFIKHREYATIGAVVQSPPIVTSNHALLYPLSRPPKLVSVVVMLRFQEPAIKISASCGVLRGKVQMLWTVQHCTSDEPKGAIVPWAKMRCYDGRTCPLIAEA